jgi:hypothetical protein
VGSITCPDWETSWGERGGFYALSLIFSPDWICSRCSWRKKAEGQNNPLKLNP